MTFFFFAVFSYRVRLLSLVRARKALRCLVLVLIL